MSLNSRTFLDPFEAQKCRKHSKLSCGDRRLWRCPSSHLLPLSSLPPLQPAAEAGYRGATEQKCRIRKSSSDFFVDLDQIPQGAVWDCLPPPDSYSNAPVRPLLIFR